MNRRDLLKTAILAPTIPLIKYESTKEIWNDPFILKDFRKIESLNMPQEYYLKYEQGIGINSPPEKPWGLEFRRFSGEKDIIHWNNYTDDSLIFHKKHLIRFYPNSFYYDFCEKNFIVDIFDETKNMNHEEIVEILSNSTNGLMHALIVFDKDYNILNGHTC